ncbi:MATH and LRR domain-containing protein PFE0570w-like isoform X2 [Galleria mellonella]|uniref:MATH and LRR domain-containing protein PFE0570w-like isoform X2 n=1 Tax=Galleria mellonella TaxID=7137 RepID=A0ABM3N0F8_GALME|nr:MATH and LRR domain-containing protein PFE0570w-like isoform X2 [Galleria mellonella]
MGKSVKSHGKKSDKETQSPVLKIFKDMMQREKDPEKANLLKEKHENRKKKSSGSRTKSNATKSCDSSSSHNNNKKYKRNDHYNVAMHEPRDTRYTQPGKHSISDRKDSWCWRTDTEVPKPKSDDTCSWVSCALKQIVSSEYTCIACLALMFTLTVVAAFYFVFRTVPTVNNEVNLESTAPEFNSVGLRRKIEMLNERKGQGINEFAGYRGSFDDRKDLDDTVSRQLRGLPGISGPEFGETSLQDLNSLDDSSNKFYSDLSTMLDNGKVNDGGSNERLIDFYKKLIETDVKIKNLKNGLFNDYTSMNNDLKYNIDRSKRSLKNGNRSSLFIFKVKKGNKNNNKTNDISLNLTTKDNNSKKKRHKRCNNMTDKPKGIFIEKKKIMVHYKPNAPLRKVPKCSHVPKDGKSHETQMKHPFYKNTEHFEELLDRFLDNNLPEVMAEPIKTDELFKTKNGKQEQVSTIQRKVIKNKDIKISNNAAGNFLSTKSDFEKDFLDNIKDDKQTTLSIDLLYNVALDMSTVMNPSYDKASKPIKVRQTYPNMRKLMQANDEDEESMSYEDFKEVLADDLESHDESDRRADRKKSREDIKFGETKPPYGPIKNNPPGVRNPNWKGSLPLYPHELNSMIKQAVIENINNANKAEVPVNTKDISAEKENSESDFNDVEYIEDYLDNKYEKLVKMAQAYSDYGVLDDKKDSRKDINQDKSIENRVKLSIDKAKYFKDKLFERLKKGTESEGIVFELKPTSNSRDDVIEFGFVKKLQKHLNIPKSPQSLAPHRSSFSPLNSDFVFFSSVSPKKVHIGDDIRTTKKFMPDKSNNEQSASIDKEKSILKSYNNFDYYNNNGRFIKRSLKSIETDNEYADDNYYTSEEDMKVNRYKNLTDRNPGATVYRKRSLKFTLDKNNTYLDTIKSIADNQKVTETNSERNIFPVNIKKLDNKHVNETIIPVNKNTSIEMDNTKNVNSNQYNNTTDFRFNDFFNLISNWFSTLASYSMDDNHSNNTKNLVTVMPNITNAFIHSNTNIVDPVYDSDIVDNIGHRSRVLMSVNSEFRNVCKIEKNKDDTQPATSVIESEKPVTVHTPNVTAILDNAKSGATISEVNGERTEAVTHGSKANENDTAKSVVKRSVPIDSNLIFWNDMYDDEYGIKVDPLESKITDKRTNEGNDFMKRSRQWLQRKVKSIADYYLNTSEHNEKNNKTKHQKNNKNRNVVYTRESRQIIKKRNIMNSNYDANKPDNFAELTIKMKEICKEAARAVHQTKNLKAREDSNEERMASSLMKQLVRLMTDLVDYQVQEKTCLKLPSDLQNFLEWLTSANSETTSKQQHMTNLQDDLLEEGYLNKYDPIMDHAKPSLNVDSEARSEYLDTLHAVQTLMQQYDGMNDESKSKMTGVKEYLENQLDFLDKQLSLYDAYNIPNIYPSQQSIRYRRDLRNANRQSKHRSNKNKSRLKGKLHMYIPKFGVKHTRTTITPFEESQIAEANKIDENSLSKLNDYVKYIDDIKANGDKESSVNDKSYVKFNNVTNDINTRGDQTIVGVKDDEKDITKRDLADVYSKASEGYAKMFTIHKNFRKN